jgi:lysylphosphatidylglycerol synthetase-like protein (DUF2156 family)
MLGTVAKVFMFMKIFDLIMFFYDFKTTNYILVYTGLWAIGVILVVFEKYGRGILKMLRVKEIAVLKRSVMKTSTVIFGLTIAITLLGWTPRDTIAEWITYVVLVVLFVLCMRYGLKSKLEKIEQRIINSDPLES